MQRPAQKRKLDQEALVVQCQNTPLGPRLAAELGQKRTELLRLEEAGYPLPIIFPADAYAIVFGLRPDIAIQRSITLTVQNERRRVQRRLYDRPGVIYMFWLTGQPINQIKIGRSEQTAQERLAEWNRKLAASRGSSVVNQLFVFATRYNVLAERLIHATLTCERIAKMRHLTTGDALTEFFQLDNLMLARLFVALCVRYANQIGDEIKTEASAIR